MTSVCILNLTELRQLQYKDETDGARNTHKRNINFGKYLDCNPGIWQDKDNTIFEDLCAFALYGIFFQE
jgi:hypothetical protein